MYLNAQQLIVNKFLSFIDQVKKSKAKNLIFLSNDYEH